MRTEAAIRRLEKRRDLTREQARGVGTAMLEGKLSFDQISRVLTELHEKGEAVEEIVGFVQAIRERMVPLKGLADAIDVCGTGGDGSNTFNISTAVAFVVAGCDVQVVKNGNRAASSRSGSADVLEALGVNIMLDATQAEEVAREVGMVFLFAPLFHPAFAHVSPVRRSLAFRTIFNFIGPLVNPARVQRQLVGVPTLAIAEKMAAAAQQLSYEDITFVVGEDGLDEVSTLARTTLITLRGTQITRSTIDPLAYGFTPASLEDLRGADAQTNAEIAMQILSGERGPKRDIVLLNSAVALVVSGKAQTIQEGIILAKRSIDSGSAKEVLVKLVKETQKYAKQ